MPTEDAGLGLPGLFHEGLPLVFSALYLGCGEFRVAQGILTGTVMGIVVADAKNCQIVVCRVGVVAVDVVQLKADAEVLANTTHIGVSGQQPVALLFSRIAAHDHRFFRQSGGTLNESRICGHPPDG